MAKDLTTSAIDRQNILNNSVAIPKIKEKIGLQGLAFNGDYYVTKKMVADFYGVDERTIERHLDSFNDEISANGYMLCKGGLLKDFIAQYGPDINVGSKTTVLGLFTFRAFLDMGMMLTESEKAKQVRSLILDVVIESINEKTGSGTKYINRRDVNYIPAAITEENYHKNLTDTIKKYVDGHETYKYSTIMDMIYVAVFKEKAKEYRKLLELDEKDNVRRTLYAEVLKVVSSFENGVAYEIKQKAKEIGPLTIQEVKEIVTDLSNHPLQTPYIYDARQKMASRDLAFRDVFHGNIAEYLRAVTPEEFDRFIGDKSIDFDAIMNLPENKEIMKILKQADNE